MTPEPTFPTTGETMNNYTGGLHINDNEAVRASVKAGGLPMTHNHVARVRTSMTRVAIGVAGGAAGGCLQRKDRSR
jgi:hypothetical protein